MNRKKLVGWIILIVGAILFLFALNAKHKIAAAKEKGEAITGFLPKNAVGSFVGGEVKEATEQYDTLVQFLFIGGIGLIVIGGVMTFLHKGSKKKN